ncbi:Peptidase inhibitor family I36 [Lentzea waywayandensis]|uniref:Peptidase inhibitor family I36 n=1 Tax=Lentzea waywayandensis TaxID=84724 RepID=A0A1I6FFL8_9PSEU|nr:peptidase inhibitor family I36 protein [Lentzea waywayandensis]SFR28704.1 Peptidase inhibitor family I36 [Lentzea waywayandensis]
MKQQTLIVVAAAVAAGVAVTTVPNAAATPNCPDGKYCLYDGADYTGRLVVSDTMIVRRMPPRADDRVSSIINNTGMDLHLFVDPDLNGFGWQDFNGIVRRGAKVSLARPRSNDNKLSSYFLCG